MDWADSPQGRWSARVQKYIVYRNNNSIKVIQPFEKQKKTEKVNDFKSVEKLKSPRPPCIEIQTRYKYGPLHCIKQTAEALKDFLMTFRNT